MPVAEQDHSAAQPVAIASGTKKKVLVVDDSRAMRRILMRTLLQAGFPDLELLEAEDGDQALRLSGQAMPDSVLADWNMPVMDGLALVRALKSRYPEVYCGLVTSDAARARSEALAAGAQFVLSKPVTVDGLRSVLAPLFPTRGPSIPAARKIAELLGSLLGSQVEVELGEKAIFAGRGLVLTGVYQGPDGAPAALVACDVHLAARLAAALTRCPPNAVGQIVSDDRLSPLHLESLRKLLETVSTLFGSNGLPHARLESIHTQLRSLPSKAVMLAVRPSIQATFTVSIPAFGSGAISFCVG